jgi:hypothetical protein
MAGLYKSENDLLADVLTVNTLKAFSVGADGFWVPASNLEKTLHKEEKAVATARLAIHKAMTDSE